MYILEQTSKRRIFSIYTGSKPIFAAVMIVIGVALALAANAAAGGLMALIGVALFFFSASVWVFDKQQGVAQRGLRWMGLSLSLWQCPLDAIAAIEVKALAPVDEVHESLQDDHSTLVLRNGQRRSLWGGHADRSRDLAKFLRVELVEKKADS